MNDIHKKIIIGTLLVLSGIVPVELWYVWFPLSLTGWLLMFNWLD